MKTTLKTATLAALAMISLTGAAMARDGSVDDGRDDGRGDDHGGGGGWTDDNDNDHGGWNHAELSCVEAYGWGRGHEVEVAEEGGRLIATVTLGGRILLRKGVDRRAAGGRDLDVLYVGKDIKIATDSYSGDGLLDYTLNGRRTRVSLYCY